jgi:hypothetical protein
MHGRASVKKSIFFARYLTVISISRLCSVGLWGDWRIGKDLEGSGRSLFDIKSQHLSGGTGESDKTQIRIAGVPTEVRSEHLPNKCKQLYLWSNLISVSASWKVKLSTSLNIVPWNGGTASHVLHCLKESNQFKASASFISAKRVYGAHFMGRWVVLYFIYHGNKGASLSVGDVDGYVIIRKLLDPIFNILPVIICRCKIHTYTELFFRKIART